MHCHSSILGKNVHNHRLFTLLLICTQLAVFPIRFGRAANSRIVLTLGQSHIINFESPITRISITNPDFADAMVTSPSQLLIISKAIGKTDMVVWDENENYQSYQIITHNEASNHQIMLKVNFAEINKNAFRELGVDFLSKNIDLGSDVGNIGSYAGRVGGANDPLLLNDNVDFLLSIPTQDFSAIIKALEEKNYLTILAKPNLSAINGAEAQFLAGGEFPIPIVSGTGGMQTVTIQFKEYGIKLGFVPTVLDSNLVNIKILAEVSSLDFENGITLSGFRIPSLVTRKTETIVELFRDQYLIIGGLLSKEIAETISRVPVLGNIPVLGKLFSSTRFQNKESELMILVSPQIIKPFSAQTLPALAND